ncbi:uncharacterized protein BCR38DRAFT_42757 [Pseudomassariella vexata]|uniref:Uncharacterized protein n=1 Tax=Pseudomassariella vexata TaxID=1141098 RepID=A0A1Y2DN68_9PEZI|nr:uncharacterized protein BCR38DRAFT_42757 [Pseudomassariella vexata]ORY60604.1 hypothetical protein BCR38DRAFT_42757 [Pseudomassariella vexata]
MTGIPTPRSFAEGQETESLPLVLSMSSCPGLLREHNMGFVEGSIVNKHLLQVGISMQVAARANVLCIHAGSSIISHQSAASGGGFDINWAGDNDV